MCHGKELANTLREYLNKLCLDISNRHVGSPVARAATAFFADTIAHFGFEIEIQEFTCIDWDYGDARLIARGESFAAFPGPYSLPCHLEAPLVQATSIGELKALDTPGKILQLHGDIAKEPIMPKSFVFYNPEEHQEIIRLLEEKPPSAIIAATQRNPEMAGGVYPFPMFEDGDFDIPNLYLTDTEGERLMQQGAQNVSLSFESRRIPATGCNIIARKGPRDVERLTFCAHIDAKKTSPGALDNGTGVASLLGLAKLLRNYEGGLGIEIIALNGEDYYSVPGQMLYLQRAGDSFDRLKLAINLDGAGYADGGTEFSFYECPEPLIGLIQSELEKHSLRRGEAWPQGDHMIFVMSGRPALAITSEKVAYLSTHITHTPRDTPEWVDCEKLSDLVFGLNDLVASLS